MRRKSAVPRLIEFNSQRQSLPWSKNTLIVTKLDRLARSTRDLLNTLAAIAAAGATFKSLGDPWRDAATPHGRLMLTVLGGLAEFERHLILARTDEGRKRAQVRGVKFGRKLKLTLHQQQEALARTKIQRQPFHNFEARSGIHRLNKKIAERSEIVRAASTESHI
jgi:DNA invertase Pin-like site-specific DNA recombinase